MREREQYLGEKTTGTCLTPLKSTVPTLNLEVLEAINKTKTNLENNGNRPQTVKTVGKELLKLAQHTDIFNTSQVLNYIAKAKVHHFKTGEPTNKNWSEGQKRKVSYAYREFCEVNGLEFTMPRYKQNSPIPLIPKSNHVEAIINNASKNMATIYTILSETAVEGEELSATPRNQINPEEGTISIIGTKQHDNGTYKLKEQTAEMLRQYLAKKPQEYPFPKQKTMRQAWSDARTKTATKQCNPEILKIPLKNLRNYAGAIFYNTMGKDPIQTMRFMRHKKLETTMDYLRGLTEFTATQEYISKIATTAEEALELLTQGFKEEAIFGEKHLYRKLK